MDYWFDVSTPADKAKIDLVKTELKLTTGTITEVSLFHPEGCHGLAYAAIFIGGHQLYPSDPDNAYNGNAIPAIFKDHYELKTPPVLTLKTWNLDDTYPHRVFVRITVLRPDEDPTLRATLDILSAIRSLLTGKRLS